MHDYAVNALVDYEQPAWSDCLQYFASVEKMLSSRWPVNESAEISAHAFRISSTNASVTATPDSDSELLDRLITAGCGLHLVKDIVGTEETRARQKGFEYLRDAQGGGFIAMNGLDAAALIDLVKLGKSWGFLMAGYRDRQMPANGTPLPCPDVLCISAHKLDGYLLFTN